jgi:serine O-acetyltransferase
MNSIKLYRISNYLYRKKVPFLPWLIKMIIFLIFNSVIPPSASIGRKSKLAYGGIGVVIHAKAKIGERVIIGQNTTVGRQLDPEGVPVIGDDVYISAGARILGDVRIGNNVIVGANSVVIKNVPDNCIVAGVPAKIIRNIDENIYTLLKNMY